MQDIKITTIQSDLVWENKEKNLERFEDKINAMFSTGFVVGVNRIGIDGDGKPHSGDSGVYDPEGKRISLTKSDTEYVETVKLSYSVIHKVRKKFAFGQDWDAFNIDANN